jgi:hypothetical protein
MERAWEEMMGGPPVIVERPDVVTIEGIGFTEDLRVIRRASKRAETRKVAVDLQSVINYMNEIGGAGYFIVHVSADPKTGQLIYQPYFLPERASDWSAATHKRERHYQGGAAKRRMRDQAEQLGLSL